GGELGLVPGLLAGLLRILALLVRLLGGLFGALQDGLLALLDLFFLGHGFQLPLPPPPSQRDGSNLIPPCVANLTRLVRSSPCLPKTAYTSSSGRPLPLRRRWSAARTRAASPRRPS